MGMGDPRYYVDTLDGEVCDALNDEVMDEVEIVSALNRLAAALEKERERVAELERVPSDATRVCLGDRCTLGGCDGCAVRADDHAAYVASHPYSRVAVDELRVAAADLGFAALCIVNRWGGPPIKEAEERVRAALARLEGERDGL